MAWYYKLIAHRPHLIIIAVGVFAFSCMLISLIRKIPDFEDPTIGFEARGSSIGKRLVSWKNLLEERKLTANPADFYNELLSQANRKPFQNKYKNKTYKKGKHKSYNTKIKYIKEHVTINKTNGIDISSFDEYSDNGTFDNSHNQWEYGKNQSFSDDEVNTRKRVQMKSTWTSLMQLNPPTVDNNFTDSLFCNSPNKEYAHLAIKKSKMHKNETLFDLNSLKAICEIEQKLTEIQFYEDLCEKQLNTNNCCRIWSLPNYISLLSNKTSCFDIDEDDITNLKLRLQECFPYYNNFKLSSECIQYKCTIPPECAEHNAVYNILHYLTDTDFIKINDTRIFLNVSMIFLPIARSTQALPFYYNIIQENLSNDLVDIVAMDMGLKNTLFDQSLFKDGWLIGIGASFVFFCMWIYTASLLITIMTLIAVLFSLVIAYFIYTFVYEMNFFPFMNLLVVVIIVGIGSDDAFIFIKIWKCAKLENKSNGYPLTSTSSFCSDASQSDRLSNLMADTLKHAALSMMVTSLTTAAAFFASYTSAITAVKCFGIFAGTTVLVNYILMVTWFPASVSIAERISCLHQEYFMKKFIDSISNQLKYFDQLCQNIRNTIISLVQTFSWLFIIVFTLIGIASGFTVLYYPQLQLPNSPDFKLFVNSHPFEVYDSVYKNYFWFDKESVLSENSKLPLRFVWGINPVDSGSYLDPRSHGSIEFDNSFNISLPQSQVWLLQFCKNLKNQSFFQPSFGFLMPNCFIENFISWMERSCYDDMSGQNRTPCCETSLFPYEPTVFNTCLQESMAALYQTPRKYFIPGVAGPKFLKHTLPDTDKDYRTNITKKYIKHNNYHNLTESMPCVALIVEYDSIYSFSLSYLEIDKFVKEVESWLQKELENAPDPMKCGWFISDLEFYDLQNSLSKDTLKTIYFSMGVASLVLIFVTLNLLVSLFAMITVIFTIFSTIAILIFLDWRLNVLESIVISTAIGLAVDFSLHYGVYYRFSPVVDRSSSTRYALSRMLGPTAMASLTTGIAGAFMLPSDILPYIQIGLFLVIIMSVSWVYSTFFLMSLLSLAGPEYGFCQFQYPIFRKTSHNKGGKNHQVEISKHSKIDNAFSVSEQFLSPSSSATGDLVGSESHELDALTNANNKSSYECNRTSLNDNELLKNNNINNMGVKNQSLSTISSVSISAPGDSDSVYNYN